MLSFDFAPRRWLAARPPSFPRAPVRKTHGFSRKIRLQSGKARSGLARSPKRGKILVPSVLYRAEPVVDLTPRILYAAVLRRMIA